MTSGKKVRSRQTRFNVVAWVKIQKIMEKLVYLAGPITGCNHKEAVDWRHTVGTKLHLANKLIKTLSPMRGKPVLPSSQIYDAATGSYEDPLRSSAGINTRDYNDVRRADLIFVNLLGATKVSIGTVMEIAWARAFNKPIVLIMEKEGNVHDHVMLKYPCGFIVPNIEEGLRVAKFILLTDQDLAYSS